MKLKQRVVVAAKAFVAVSECRHHTIRHAAEGGTIDDAGLHGETDDAASELIHDDHDPVSFEGQRFTTEEIDTPEAIFGMSEKGEPRRAVGVAGRPTVFYDYPPHNVLIDLDAEDEGNLLSDVPAAKRGLRLGE